MKITTEGLTIEFEAGQEESVARLLRHLQGGAPKRAAPKQAKPQPAPAERKHTEDGTARLRRTARRTAARRLARVTALGGSQAVRKQAAGLGLHVSNVGFIPNEVLDACEAANGKTAYAVR